jgi:N-acetylglutamate synthase-like GNAT family acetyltransferase
LNIKYIRATCIQLNQFYKENHDKARAKPTDIMFAAINKNNHICSVLRLLPYSNFLFLRSVLTTPDCRGKGIASNLILHTLHEMKHQFISTSIFTLPTPLAQTLYQRLGFTFVEQDQIPNELLSSYRRLNHSSRKSMVMVIIL